MGIRLGWVSFDEARGRFEAHADRDGLAFRRPARVAGPPPRAWADAMLADRSSRLFDSGRPHPP